MFQRRTSLLAHLALLASACSAAATSHGSGPPAGTVFRHPGFFAGEGGEVVAFEAGELFVPESHARPTARVISIPFQRLPSTAAAPATPIFILAGGPGESAIDDFVQDADARAMALFFRETADVILLDQRGAGGSRPRLDCPQHIDWPPDRALTREAYVAELRRQAANCRDGWQRQGIAVAAYNTVENAADVDALRQALGYKRMSLVGHSFGTHLSLALMRLYPGSIERAILHGVEGPDHQYDLPSQTLAALSRIAAAAEKSPALRSLVPPQGLIAALRSVETRLAKSPVSVRIERDGRPVSVTISRHDIERLARHGADDRSDLAWPAYVIDMYRGDFESAARAVLDSRDWSIASALLFMTDCSSGASPARLARIRKDPAELHAAQVLGDINLTYFAACGVWGNPDLGADFRADVHSTTPVLFFQGTWDVSTPLENAQEVARGFPNGKLVSVEGGTHFTLHDLFRAGGEIRPLLRDFLQGKPVDPPQRLELPEPAFRLPRSHLQP